jgi:protein TonB
MVLAVMTGCVTNPQATSEPPADHLSAVDVMPVPRFQAQPRYPREMLRQHISGAAVIEFIVDRDGSVQRAKVVSQTNELFGAAAVECVMKWRFNPALRAGVPVRCIMTIPINFACDAQ